MSEIIKRSALEDLINFLFYRPQAAKYLPSVLKDYKENIARFKNFKLNGNKILIQICQILSNELVVTEKRFKKLLNLSKEEIRSRLNYLIKKHPERFSIDRTDKENWIFYLSKEGLINV